MANWVSAPPVPRWTSAGSGSNPPCVASHSANPAARWPPAWQPPRAQPPPRRGPHSEESGDVDHERRVPDDPTCQRIAPTVGRPRWDRPTSPCAVAYAGPNRHEKWPLAEARQRASSRRTGQARMMRTSASLSLSCSFQAVVARRPHTGQRRLAFRRTSTVATISSAFRSEATPSQALRSRTDIARPTPEPASTIGEPLPGRCWR